MEKVLLDMLESETKIYQDAVRPKNLSVYFGSAKRNMVPEVMSVNIASRNPEI